MAQQNQKQKQATSSKKLSRMAMKSVDIFKKENPKEFKELVKQFEGKSADVALFGHGNFHISVKKSDIKIIPDKVLGRASSGRGAIYPETLIAILEGKLTVMEAFHKGDLIARSDSPNLHLVYTNFVKYSDTALRSKQMQVLLAKFRKQLNI